MKLMDECIDGRGLFEFVYLCKSLEELHLDSMMIDIEDVKGIAKMSNLKILRLNSVYGINNCFDLLFKNMDLTNIEVIDCRGSRITENHLKDIIHQGCPNLEKLFLDNFKSLKMSEDTFKVLVENHPKMKLLGLENVVHDVTDECLYKIISKDKFQIILDGGRWKKLKKFERYNFPHQHFISEELASRNPAIGMLLDKSFSEDEVSSSEEETSGEDESFMD